MIFIRALAAAALSAGWGKELAGDCQAHHSLIAVPGPGRQTGLWPWLEAPGPGTAPIWSPYWLR